MGNWYKVQNESEVATPALLIYTDRVEKNLDAMIEMAGDASRLRPHVKTHKMGALIDLQVSKGITKYKCATIAEAEMCAIHGAKDILLAYPLTGPQVQRYLQLMKQYPNTVFSTTVDHQTSLDSLIASAADKQTIVNVFLDIDNGMNRTGIAVGEEAKSLYSHMNENPWVALMGIHVYDGHIHDQDLQARTTKCETAFAPVDQFIVDLKSEGYEVPYVVAGGTPTFPIHARVADRQLSPGTPVLWDHGYAESFPDLGFLNAAVLMTRVVSLPGTGRICLDLGYKAVASEMPHPRVKFLALPAYQVLNHSEEHLVIKHDGQVEVGEVYYAIPTHICPTVAKYDEVWLVAQGSAKTLTKVTARSRKLNI